MSTMRAASGDLSRKELLLNSFKLGRIDKDLFGPTPPSAFVGRFGYPEVLAGFLQDRWYHPSVKRSHVVTRQTNGFI